ncbi:MAG: PQQ-dependent sugar dehydrogenase [Bacteroidota bacterium]|nr:PQQ-dependent sugar dehydrogenase [Bacteroidota bacterium]
MKHFMYVFACLLFCLPALSQTTILGGRQNEVFLKTDLSPANGLNDPWEITYGPDDSLWITESKGYAVYKLSPNGGTKRKILDINQKSTWLGNTPASDSVFNLQFTFSPTNPQGGLAGLAIHPAFLSGKPYVYISYIRSYVNTVGGNGGVFYTNRVARFTYNFTTGRLETPVSLCDTLPGSSDHNSQRMIIAPVNGVNYLFYAAGDMGAGQFANQNRTNNAQNTNKYEGKILRFNLESDGDAGTLDKWIPNDNPYNGAKQSAVWAIGIRNNQGFAYDSVRDILYGSSHGPYSDDEVNIIQPSKNYGHPLVIGFAADTNYNGSSAGAYPSSSLSVITNEVTAAAAIGASYKDPLFVGYNWIKDSINKIWTTQPNNGTWPSEGWSGLGLYNYSIIPDWKNSLIMAGLKWGRLIRTRLDANGTAIVPTNGKDTVCYFDSNNRYRDIAFGPNGKDIFVIMDKSAATSGPSANNPSLISCAGCVQKYTFLGYNSSGGTSTIPSSVTIAAAKPGICENANTININTNNANLWVPITDTLGNVLAEINANGNILGNVTTSVYLNNGTVRESGYNKVLYLDRNLTITPTTQPSTAVSIRLYMRTAEFNSLKTALNTQGAGSGVSAITDLAIFKNSDACGSAINVMPTRITTTNQAAFGSTGYVVQANITSFSSFYFAGVTSLLPVQLISFNANLVNDNTQLQWTTADAQNSQQFVIERSADGKNFSAIGTLPAKTGNGVVSYAMADSNIARAGSSVVYYRLKIVDNDGSFSYSRVVSVRLAKKAGRITVSPNPVNSSAVVVVNATVAESARWQISDISGKPVMARTISLVKGDNSFTLSLGSLPAGSYYLKVTGNNISESVKLQKQ